MKKRCRMMCRSAAVCLVALLLSGFGIAQTVTPKTALERLFTSESLQTGWFAEGFLNEITLEQLSGILQDLQAQLGSFERVEGEASPFTVVFAEGTARAQISLNSEAQIQGLFFDQLNADVGSLEEAIEDFANLSGQLSVLVLSGDEVLASLEPETPLAVGSSFKLLVLSVLQDQITSGDHAWDEVVALDPSWRSLPSGVLQDWPEGSPLTLQTLATLMISQSDNTATDALIAIVGREALEAESERNRPFLTTQELFKLKDPANEGLLERYLSDDEAEKREVLTELETRSLPSVDVFSGDPRALEAEWFFTTRELCEIMAEVESLPIPGVNPGVADPEAWARVAFKGGSEPGVLNLTSWLVAEDGSTYCVSATQNNPEATLDEGAFTSLYSGLLNALGD